MTTLYPLSELPADLKAKWAKLARANPGLPGPCFHPDLFCAVGREFRDAYVAVLSQGDKLGFLPFYKDASSKLAASIPMCDYQAVIGAPGTRWNLDEALRDLGLVAWDFEYLVGLSDLEFGSAFLKNGGAPRIDLRQGTDAYFKQMLSRDVSLRNLMLKRDKLQKKHGEIRFVQEEAGSALIDTILAWKAKRFNDGKPIDPRVKRVLETLKVGDEVAGITSGLYAGDALVAAHFGIRLDGILHYWFPGFNPEFGRFTPGHLLVYELLMNLEGMGCKILDFGPGGEAYKQYFCNDSLPVTSGGIELFSRFTLARRCRRNLESAVRSTGWLYKGVQPIVRKLRNLKTRP